MIRAESEGQHVTTAYPVARVVGCSCGWTRKGVSPDVMDDLIVQHLNSVGVPPL